MEQIEDLIDRLKLRLERDPAQNLYIHRDTLKLLLEAADTEKQ